MDKKEIKSAVTWDELFMRSVYLIASKSKDPRTKIGAILVKDGVIISQGYNGFARGVKDYEERYVDRQQKLKFVVHAECNSILNAVRHGINTSGSVCYTQGKPCCDCSKTLIQAGITEIIIHSLWPMSPTWGESSAIGITMFQEAGVRLREFNQSLGIVGHSDGKIINI